MSAVGGEPLVFVVDDDRLVRESLAWLVESIDLPVQLFASAGEILDVLDQGVSGCIVLDVRMPGISGLELLDMLAQRDVAMPVILVTGHADVPMAIRAMKSGAFDFIEKPYNDQAMLDCIQSALEYERDHRVRRQRREDLRSRFTALTPREHQVMARVVQGLSNKLIAADLGISIKTVELHRSHLMSKVAVKSSAALVRLAVLAGLDGCTGQLDENKSQGKP